MARMAEELNKELLDKLVCPETHAPLLQAGDWLYSTDRASRRRYPIRNGIPVMLVDEAEIVDEAEYDKVMQNAEENSGQ
jgi:hypothetical protein